MIYDYVRNNCMPVDNLCHKLKTGAFAKQSDLCKIVRAYYLN